MGAVTTWVKQWHEVKKNSNNKSGFLPLRWNLNMIKLDCEGIVCTCADVWYLLTQSRTSNLRSLLRMDGLTKRATLERSVRGAVLIGCWKTMQMTGSKSEIQYGGQNAAKIYLQAWTVNVCKCCNNNVFESKHPVDLYWPRLMKESFLNRAAVGWAVSCSAFGLFIY